MKIRLKNSIPLPIQIIFLLTALIIASACSHKITASKSQVAVTSGDSVAEEELWFPCTLTNTRVSFAIDSCNCDEIATDCDSIYISISPFNGGEIQNRLLKFQSPKCDSSYYLVMKFQNRYFTSSMGPDPVYADWIFYTSPNDTIRYNAKRKGFVIDSISEEQQARFPKFDTLDFYKAYKKSVYYNLDADYFPSNAKNALYEEYLTNKDSIRDILEQSGVELHRVILELHHDDAWPDKVFVFTYGHFG